MHVLYRKYRPKTFAEVVGQNHIKVTLANEIIRGQLAHAYLFVGPRGTGKTTIARLFARAVNCIDRKTDSAEPCNQCQNCRAMLQEQSFDIIEVDAATHTDVDNVRDNIITNAHVPPYYKKGYKVFIIDEVHMLSKHAFNALLKTIEEPPSHAIFILATTDVYKVPETIISRCQRFDFKKIPQKLIVERLSDLSARERVTVPVVIIQGIAQQSGGFLRDAESLLGQVLTMAEKGIVSEELASIVIQPSYVQQVEKLIRFLQQRSAAAALEFVQILMNEGLDTEKFFADMIEFVRQMVLKKAIGPTYTADLDESTSLVVSELANNFTLIELQRLLGIFLKYQQQAPLIFIPQLPIELACIEFCTDTSESLPIKEVVRENTPVLNAQALMPEEQRALAAGLIKRWTEVLNLVKETNHSLAVFMKVAHPLSVSDSMVLLGFRYDFHADKVKEEKNRHTIQKILSEILGRTVTIDCIVDTNYTDNHKNFNGGREQEVQDVLDVMGGGEVV